MVPIVFVFQLASCFRNQGQPYRNDAFYGLRGRVVNFATLSTPSSIWTRHDVRGSPARSERSSLNNAIRHLFSGLSSSRHAIFSRSLALLRANRLKRNHKVPSSAQSSKAGMTLDSLRYRAGNSCRPYLVSGVATMNRRRTYASGSRSKATYSFDHDNGRTKNANHIWIHNLSSS